MSDGHLPSSAWYRLEAWAIDAILISVRHTLRYGSSAKLLSSRNKQIANANAKTAKLRRVPKGILIFWFIGTLTR